MVFSLNRFFNKLWDIMRKFECLFQNMLTFSEYLNCCQFYTQRACIFRYLYLKIEYIVCWEICGHTHMPIVNDYKSKNVTLTLTWYKSVIDKLFSNFQFSVKLRHILCYKYSRFQINVNSRLLSSLSDNTILYWCVQFWKFRTIWTLTEQILIDDKANCLNSRS